MLSFSFVAGQSELLVDIKATKETVNLYRNLKRLLNKGFMFGHQDDIAYGVDWKYVTGKSDIKEITRDYPVVQGFELGRPEVASTENIVGVPFDKMKGYIINTYNLEGLSTLIWPLKIP